MDFPFPVHIISREQEQLMDVGAPSHIFVARTEQEKAFRSYLGDWCKSIDVYQRMSIEELYPSSLPLRGLVVFIYGHGGTGKSALLGHYCQVAAECTNVRMSRIMSWQNPLAISSFQHGPQMERSLHVRAFFASFAEKLAKALNIHVSALKEYEQACRSLNHFREQLRKVPSLSMAEKQYKQLQFSSSFRSLLLSDESNSRQSDSDQLAYHIEAFLRNDSYIPDIWRLEIENVLPYACLQGENMALLCDPGSFLAEALGRDLSMYARTQPLLLFFDCYENIMEQDKYLRLVMHAAGERVGWVIASCADLWSSNSYRQLYPMEGESYQEIVMPNRGLPIDLNSPASGLFSVHAIRCYFNKLRAQRPLLPIVPADLIERIAVITQGIPLGVRIMAELYMRDPAVLFRIAPVSSPTEVIDQLMLHYLAYPGRQEKLQLCGLALLRRMTNTEALSIVLGLSPDQPDLYADVMARLYKHADFVFEDHGAPFLHGIVRHIIRQWLLKHHNDPDKRDLFYQLKNTYSKSLEEVKRAVAGNAIRDLFASVQWIEASLELIEMLFWIDAEMGMRDALQFLIAAALYDYTAAHKLIEIVTFFELQLSEHSLNYWQDTVIALSLTHDQPFTGRQKVQRLTTIIDDFAQQPELPDTLLSSHRHELIALLYWKIGNAYLHDERSADERSALKSYRRAWEVLHGDEMLQNSIVQLCLQGAYNAFDHRQYDQSEFLLNQACDIQYNKADIYYTLGNIYYVQRDYESAITFYQYAIVIERDHFYAYMNLGNAHYICKEYRRAVDEYNHVQVLTLGPLPPSLYYNRANAYSELHLFNEAKDDYTRAIQLDPQLAWAYGNRGHVHAVLQNYTAAQEDYRCAARLAPDDINVVWTATWAEFTAQKLQAEDCSRLLHIMELDPRHHIAFICQAIVEGIQNNDWIAALAHIEQAAMLAPDEGDTHFWKGLVAAYLKQTIIAKEEIEQALSVGLPPLFLTPLRWLQNDNPEFFTTYIKLLLQR